MHKRMMHVGNWIAIGLGVVVFYVGMGLISTIQRNYDSPYAFVSVLTLNIGLWLVVGGLLWDTQDKQKSRP